ncbi:DoxX family membrane protein [Streptomyces sp. NPDC038707]|uniref:DoxX family membrane protein n=1 Tax=Streptomyces sp. NPDC038707 TaxID=3154329 RepID=UPI0033C97401
MLHRAAGRYRPGSLTVLRVSVGVVYCWFGVLKLFPATSPAEHIALQTMTKLTGGLVPAQVSLPLLGTTEALIGLALISGFLLRPALVAFYAHMSGVFSSLVLLPDAMWHHGAPTLDGQYVLKNLVLVTACLAVTADDLTR